MSAFKFLQLSESTAITAMATFPDQTTRRAESRLMCAHRQRREATGAGRLVRPGARNRES